MREYVVEISRRPLGDVRPYAETLADVFNLSIDKAEALLARLPGVVTKPVPEPLARAIAQRFQNAGMDAHIRLSGEAAAPAEAGLQRTGQAAPTTRARPPLGERARPPAGAAAGIGAAPSSPHPAPAAPEIPEMPPSRASRGDPATRAREAMSARNGAATPVPESGAWRGGAAVPRTPTLADTEMATDPEVAVAGAGSAPLEAKAAPRRRGSIRSKLLAIAILPTLLAIIGALVVVWFVVRPALYEQLLDSARNPAIATAASLSSTLSGEDGGGGAGLESLRLLETIQVARQTFPRDSISFIVATSSEGEPISGWFEEEQGFESDSRALEQAIQAQAVGAVARGASATRADSTGSFELTTGERIEIVAQPLLGPNNQALGTVVVGVTDRAVTEQVMRILLTTLLFSLIPLALAIIFAVARSRSFTRNILRLTDKADDISRGNLDASVDDIRSNDELEDLAAALERMRSSMQEAMTRLRRRRGQAN